MTSRPSHARSESSSMLKSSPEHVDAETTEVPRRRSVGRTIGITVYSIVAGIVVLALIATGFVVYTIQRSFPQLDGAVAVAGLGDEVTVQRDVLGVPTI